MNKFKDKNQPITRGDFQDLSGDVQKLSGDFQQFTDDYHEFAEFITNTAATKDNLKLIKDDLKHIKNELATGDAIRKIVKEEVRPMKEELEDKITEFKSEILNHIDAAMGELKDTRQEQVMDAGHHHRTDQKLEAHERRITRLEAKAGVA